MRKQIKLSTCLIITNQKCRMKLNISKIEAYLESNKISNKAFSAQIGMTEIGWSQMKKRGSTSGETWIKIAKAMGVDPNTILYDHEPAKSKTKPKTERNLFINPVSEITTQRLYEFMKLMEMTQLELSETIGIPDRTLTYQLSNKAVTISTINAISTMFTDVNINWFFRENVPFMLSDYNSLVAEPNISYGSNPIFQINERLRNIEEMLKKK